MEKINKRKMKVDVRNYKIDQLSAGIRNQKSVEITYMLSAWKRNNRTTSNSI